jgi:hypothetical protein
VRSPMMNLARPAKPNSTARCAAWSTATGEKSTPPARRRLAAQATARGRRVRVPDQRGSARAQGPGPAPGGGAGRPRRRRTARPGAAGQARPAARPAGSRGMLLLRRNLVEVGGRRRGRVVSRWQIVVVLRHRPPPGIGTSRKVCHLARATGTGPG